MKNTYSAISLTISLILIFLVSFFYYPKWKNSRTEAIISWDVSGYYMYLPAFFIYKDIKKCSFQDEIIKKYYPSPTFDQALKLPNGNYVMKYPIGQAIQFMPFFFAADLCANNSDKYEADGFSRPYQFALAIEIFLIAFLGLFFLRKVLLYYYRDIYVAITIFVLAFATNYLEYSSMTGAMTHNNLFTIYAILIYFSHKFYRNPRYIYAIAIGFLVGLATITRVTEFLSILIPVLWGIKLSKDSLFNKITFLKNHYKKILSAALVGFLVVSIQLIYWKYVSGSWFVYSYDDQGFSFLSPHFDFGFFSYNNGWLVYTPVMVFALIGFYSLWKKKNDISLTFSMFFVVFTYVVFSWDIWWYGGSLGARAMVQSYVVLAFPMSAFFESTLRKKYLKYVIFFLILFFSYYNLWLTHQAHRGGMYRAGQMTKAYFWKIFGTYEMDKNNLKLLDIEEEFTGIRKNVNQIYFNDFEKEQGINSCESSISGKKSLCLNAEHQYSKHFIIEKNSFEGEWLRASADFYTPSKEWNLWYMTTFEVVFRKKEKKVKYAAIRIQRILDQGITQNIFLDMKFPKEDFDNILVKFSNSSSPKEILIDNLKLDTYYE